MTNVVGLKPTRGAISTAGVVPACRTLDCVAVFARSIADALRVERTVAGFDPADPFSRRDADEVTDEPAVVDSFRVGVPEDDALEFFDTPDAPELFDAAVERLSAIGGTVVTVDYEPFRRTAELLYGGPWVAERLAAIRPFLEASPDSVHPITRAVIERGDDYSAVDAFEARYELQGLRRAAEDVLADVDLLATPTVAPAYTIEAVEEAPIDRNSDLGYYTNHVNLLDLAALAVPAGFRRSGIPFGITLQAPAFEESLLGAVGETFCREHPPRGVLDD
jgi:allophanate hydrolase